MHLDKTGCITGNVNNSQWLEDIVLLFSTYLILTFYKTHTHTPWKWRLFSKLLYHCKLYVFRQISNPCFIHRPWQFDLIKLC